MKTVLSLTLIALLVAGCGGGGPAADEGKSKEQVRTDAAAMDKPALEKMIAEYNEVLSAKMKEMADMVAEKGAELMKGADENVSALEKEIGGLTERLQIYVNQLEKK